MSSSSSSFSSPERDAADSVGWLTKRLAAADDDSETDTLRRRTAPSPWQDARPGSNRYLVAAVVLLGATNLPTLLAALGPLRSSCPQLVNHPPTSVARAVEHLVTEPKSQLLKLIFYEHEHGIPGEHHSNVTDVVWYEYTQVMDSELFLVSQEGAAQAALDPARHVYFDNPKLGLEGFPLKLEVTRQMHCLDLLRMNLYYNMEYTRATCGLRTVKSNGELARVAWVSPDHCIGVLRLCLQCTADNGVTPLLWLSREGRVTGDMARMHTCSNCEKERGLVKDKTIPFLKKGDMKPYQKDLSWINCI